MIFFHILQPFLLRIVHVLLNLTLHWKIVGLKLSEFNMLWELFFHVVIDMS